ncbi:glycosyltransferase family 4 protein [Acinetobacter sp. YH01026]|uniref:glycosyltransferase family 4 protein n=1 Tax=Acinetobacter sp. YH01026 TaxID=2601039 RepID=UPI0015D2BDAC|nr:glycosyltransferase family 4 protein [Acinetobacter sp. YH01026]
MKNKIYLITEYYHENQNTTGYLLGKLYNFLNEQSDIDLVLIAKKDEHCPQYDNAHYITSPQLNKRSLFKRFFYEVIISIKFFFEILRNVRKGSTVFTGTTPIFLLMIIFFTKKIKNLKWILLVHDVFPENLIAANVLRNKSYFYKFLKYFFDKIYASADQVVVIGHDMKELVHSKTRLNNIHVVQNWIDYEDIEVQEKSENKILKELNWHNTDVVVFQFFGNIGRVQGVDVICKAIQKMQYPHLAKFIFIGDGAYASALEEQINKLKLDNVCYWGALDQKEKSVGLNACDVALVTLTEGMWGLGVPSKSYFTMAADKPILAIMEEQAEVSTMVKQHNIGWTIPPEDVEALAKKLDDIALNFDQYKLNSPRNVLIENYAESIAMQKILKIINELYLVDSK